ncbi:MAG TPA: hypothetical protein VJ927_00950 [Actinomycetota bacterium]|nr:hypothetical protein [Actinomycetota bacterium]
MLIPGLILITIGLLVAIFLSPVLGIIVLILGVAAAAMSFSAWGPGPGAARRTTIIERDRRPVTRERETIRETEI